MALQELDLHHSGKLKDLKYSEELDQAGNESDEGTNNMDNKKKPPEYFPSPSRVYDWSELPGHISNDMNKKPLSSSARVHDWSELPRDISILIADKMRFFPHLQKFGAACNEWRHITCETIETLAAKIKSEPPMLLLPYNQKTQIATFLELKNSEMYDVKMPELKDQWICGASNGWLAMVDNNLDLFLFNTVTRARIRLPPLHPSGLAVFREQSDATKLSDRFHLIRKVALSGDPSSSECIIAICYSNTRKLSICRLGDKDWTMEENQWRQNYSGIFFYQGKFFALKDYYYIHVFEYHKQGDLRMIKVIQEPFNDIEWSAHTRYLVESSGDLFYVKSICIPNKPWGFEVYKYQPTSENEVPWSRVYDLGDRSLFYGLNDCIFMSVKEFPWCKSNCIYFTNDRSWFTFYGYEWDTGVYSLKENRVIARFDIHHPVPIRSASAIWYRPKI